MVNYFIYAKDYSASTSGISYYHENGLKTLYQFKSDIEKINGELAQSGESTESRIIYLHWGHTCEEVDEETAVEKYKKKHGNGNSTLPQTIITWMQGNIDCSDDKNNIKLLYIITDGMISSYCADSCFELNRDMYYKQVVFHAFHQRLQSIDLSVAASFLKGQCSVYRNNELFDDTDISVEFDYDKINVENFTTEKEELKSYVKLKYIKSSKSDARTLVEIDKLKKLRDRLFKELASDSLKSDNKLNTTDKNIFLQEFMNTRWYKNLSVPSHDVKVDMEKSISTLINYIINDKKSYSFDALKFDKTFKDEVQEEEIVDLHFAAEQEIEFPDIILEEDKGVPVILLTVFNLLDKLIFHTTDNTDEISPASFSKFKSTMECPLFLVNDSDISESIGYFYTLTVYKQLLENTNKTEPRTRRPYHGGLVLIDTDEFDKYNDYVLSATYFDKKKVNYNIGLFYFVLWKNCAKKEWMDENVVERLKKYVMRRISATVCKVGLSSLPLDPPERTSLLTALWYCVELSSCIFKDDPQNYMHERLRMHHGIAHFMMEILQNFNYDLDLEFIRSRKDLIRNVMILKKISPRHEKVYFLLEKIFRKKNGFLVCEIEKPFNLKKLNYLKFNHKEMLSDDIVEEEVHLNEFVHLMHYFDCKNKVKMCDKTFRPFFMIEQNKSFYTELLQITERAVITNDNDAKKIKVIYEALNNLDFSKILSYYNLFIKYVIDNKSYPSLAEYLEYITAKKKYKEELITIFPPNVYDDAEHVYSCYENVIKNVDVYEFAHVCKMYVSRIERIKVEGIQKFNSDDEIKEFISGEESKVNLIKHNCSDNAPKKKREVEENSSVALQAMNQNRSRGPRGRPSYQNRSRGARGHPRYQNRSRGPRGRAPYQNRSRGPRQTNNQLVEAPVTQGHNTAVVPAPRWGPIDNSEQWEDWAPIDKAEQWEDWVDY